MQKMVLPGFGLGLWDHEFSDLKNPPGSLQVADEVYVGDGDELRLRGPVSQLLAADAAPDFAFSGALLPGRRMVWGGGNGGKLQVMNPTGPAAVQLVSDTLGDVTSVALIGDLMVIAVKQPGGGQLNWVYGGGLKPDYTNTLTYTQGSKTVTGTGFTANVDVGMLALGSEYVVRSVDSNTSLTLNKPWLGATGSSAITMFRIGQSAGLQIGLITSPPAVGERFFAAAAGRLLALSGSELKFSNGPDPATGASRPFVGFGGANLHTFPNTTGNGIAVLRDTAFVFTDEGIYTVRGMAYEIVDGSGTPQHQIELMSGETIPLGQQGIAQWQNALIVPCRDEIYVMDGISAPVKISRGLPWAEWVRGGMVVGWATTFNGYYFLPIKRGGGSWETLCVRLAGAESSSGPLFPTTRLRVPGRPQAWANHSPSSLLAPVSGKLLEAVTIFDAHGLGADWDHEPVCNSMVIRSQLVDLGDKAVVRRVRLRYTVNGERAASETAALTVTVVSEDSSSSVELALGAVGGSRWVAFDLDTPVEASAVRVQVELEDTATPTGSGLLSAFVLHAIEIQYRAFGGAA